MESRTRRGFGAVLGLGFALALGGPAEAQTKALKMQASWPASLTLYENFTDFGKRLETVTGGRIKIEAMPAGQVVPAFEVLDATHKKVLDGAHSGAALAVTSCIRLSRPATMLQAVAVRW